MNPETPSAIFGRQQQKYKELFWQEMRRYGKPLGNTIAPPKTVLSFVEDLMICPTEIAAQVRIGRDLEAARGCYIISGDVASATYAGRAAILIPVGQNETPLCLLSLVVRLRCEASIEKFGNAWNSLGI